MFTRFRKVVPLFVLVSLVSALGLISPGARADEDRAAELDRPLSPYFFIENGDPATDQLPLQSTDVKVNVAGVIADVTVTQVYKNDGKKPISAQYVFPASVRAAVHGMKMRVGDVVITAKIKEREQAKEEFEQAKKEGKSATLLEQDRPNVFRMQVANILPGDRIEVELKYTELLVPNGGIYELVYPTVVGPRYAGENADARDSQFVASPYTTSGQPPSYALSIQGTVNAGVPIKELGSPSHKLNLASAGSSARFNLNPTEKDGGNRDFILRYRLAGDQVQTGLMLFEGEREKFFLLMMQPPKAVKPEEIPPREYVFVIDVSGSMEGFPLDTTKALMRKLIGNLKPTDKFNVILFAGRAAVMSPTSVPATQQNLADAMKVIDSQAGGGGTDLLPALQAATNMPEEPGWSRSIVVITDGFIESEAANFTYIKENLGKANLFSFGIGSSVNRYLVDGLAKAGLGEPFVVTGPDEAPAVAEKLRAYIEQPVLTDIKIAFDGFNAYDVEPAQIPDLMADRPIVIFGKWTGDAKGSINLTGVSGRGVYRQGIGVVATQQSVENRPLSYLWARNRIAALSDFNFGREASEDERKEIVDLGLTYNLLTRYTSFLAVYERVRNASGESQNVDQPLPLPQGVSDAAVGDIGVGAEPELVWLLALVLLAAGIMIRRRQVRLS